MKMLPNKIELLKIYTIAFLAVTLILSMVIVCSASDYTDEQIVNAIYRAEGGVKASFAYGIRSIPYRDIKDARRICFNTVRNNRIRFTRQSKYKDFLEFLASRYCPTQGFYILKIGCDNDRGTNKYWLKNVRYYLERSK